MSARLDVTPKTTEHNRIVRTSKSEAEVTNNKKNCARGIVLLTQRRQTLTDRHEASRGLSATAELLVSIPLRLCLYFVQLFTLTNIVTLKSRLGVTESH